MSPGPNPYQASESFSEARWPRRWAFSLTVAVIFGIAVGSGGGFMFGWNYGWKDCAREQLVDINDGVLFGSPDR